MSIDHEYSTSLLSLLFSNSIDDLQRDFNFSWSILAFALLFMLFIKKSRCQCEQKWHETIKQCDNTVDNAVIVICVEVVFDAVTVN